MRKSVLFIGAFLIALVNCSSFAFGDSLSSSGSSSVSVNATLSWTSNNCADSSAICGTNLNSSSFPNPGFTVTVPGVTLPSGSVITDATLNFSFPNTTASGGYSLTSYGIVDYGYSYIAYYTSYSCGFLQTCYEPVYAFHYNSYGAPGYSVTGTLNGTFASVTSPDSSASLGSQNAGSIDLLAAGFGSDLAAGDSLTLFGNATSNLDFFYTYNGYNSDSTADMSANLDATPQATLNIDYTTAPPDPTDTPEPSSLAMLSIAMIGLGVVRKK